MIDTNFSQKFSQIAILGATNSGKSTLINKIIGTKISIISRKVQTTRSCIRGVKSIGNAQLVFLDTPGFFTPTKNTDTLLIRNIWAEIRTADLILLLIDPNKEFNKDFYSILSRLKKIKKDKYVAINKIDKVNKRKLLPIMDFLKHENIFKEIFLISALKGNGLDSLLTSFVKEAKKGLWLFPKGVSTDLKRDDLASEITREKIYDRLHQEIPYQIVVKTEEWKEKKRNMVVIFQSIYVKKEKQKNIVIGKKGAVIKSISIAARKDMKKIFRKNVSLYLKVKYK